MYPTSRDSLSPPPTDDLSWIIKIGEGKKVPLPGYDIARSNDTLQTIIKSNANIEIEVVMKYAERMFKVIEAACRAMPPEYIPDCITPADFVVVEDKLRLAGFIKRGYDESKNELPFEECLDRKIYSYKSPEALLGEASDKQKSLVWSLAVIIHELATHKVPFQRANNFKSQAEQPVEFAEGLDENLKAILARMLAKNPDERANLAQAKRLFAA